MTTDETPIPYYARAQLEAFARATAREPLVNLLECDCALYYSNEHGILGIVPCTTHCPHPHEQRAPDGTCGMCGGRHTTNDH